ncbi:unnamed protein product [Chilo suppressalis]|uniref:Uncharacterized protein n=1 Tax=Chilo suppressalis TaxID=168631 RepID=A0ABN8AZH4_CHISP|nr:unnamed protein product [Chilo suppressalis]
MITRVFYNYENMRRTTMDYEKDITREKDYVRLNAKIQWKKSGMLTTLRALREIKMLIKDFIADRGKPPDFLAFSITLLMMMVLVAGVKKSLFFNNVLNAINLSVWVFIMAAGLFYVNIHNWTDHKGFLPYGWSGNIISPVAKLISLTPSQTLSPV